MNRVEPQEPLPPSPPLPSPELGDSWLTRTAHDRSCPRVWTGRRVDVLRASCPCPQVTARTRSFCHDRQDMPSPAICRASWRETLQRAVTFQQSEGRRNGSLVAVPPTLKLRISTLLYLPQFSQLAHSHTMSPQDALSNRRPLLWPTQFSRGVGVLAPGEREAPALQRSSLLGGKEYARGI